MRIVSVKATQIATHKYAATLVCDKDYILNSVTFKRLAQTAVSPYDVSGLVGAVEETAVITCLEQGQSVRVVRICPTDPSDLASCMATPRRVKSYTNAIDRCLPATLLVHTPASWDTLDYTFTNISIGAEYTSGIYAYYYVRSRHYGDGTGYLKIPAALGCTSFQPDPISFPAGVGSVVTLADPFIASACIAETGIGIPDNLPIVVDARQLLGNLFIDANDTIRFTGMSEGDSVCRFSFVDPNGDLDSVGNIAISNCNGEVVNHNTIIIADGTNDYALQLSGVDRSLAHEWNDLYPFPFGKLSTYTINGVFIYSYNLFAVSDGDIYQIATFTDSVLASSVAVANDNKNQYKPALDPVTGLPILIAGEPTNVNGDVIVSAGSVAYDDIDLVIATTKRTFGNASVKVFYGSNLDSLAVDQSYTNIVGYPQIGVSVSTLLDYRKNDTVNAVPSGAAKLLVYPMGLYLTVVG